MGLKLSAAPAGRLAGSTMSREMRLLTCVARVSLDPTWEARLRSLLEEPVGWDTLLELALRHRMLPLLHQHLRSLGPDAVPPSFTERLEQMAARNARQSLLLTAELRQVLRLFASQGIEALAYKGPVLAQCLYGRVTLRAMGDLDILVLRRDVGRARELLAARGYRAAVPLTDQQDRSLFRSDSNYPVVRDDTGVVIELHWTPEVGIPPAVVEVMWTRGEQVRIAGEEARTFCRQDLLLLLAMHGCRHMWERLEWICGFAELVRTDDVEWDELLALATRLGSKRALLVGLAIAERLLDAPVPEPVMAETRRDRQVEPLVAAATAQLLRGEAELAHCLGRQFHSFQLRSMERLRDRVRYVTRRAFNPSKDDFRSLRLPDGLFVLYVPLRPLLLTGRYIHQSLRGS
jgi:hypothetical protein